MNARDLEELLNPSQQATSVEAVNQDTDGESIEEVFSLYAPYGLTYDKEKNYLIYNGKIVRSFVDILSSKGSVQSMSNEEGTIDVYAVRDYSVTDADGNGKLTGVKARSQEEFDKRTEERANQSSGSVYDIGTINQATAAAIK